MVGMKPLTRAEVAEGLGYEIQRDGSWKLVRPDARPKPRPGLCRGCSKFDAMFDGLCAGCTYFGVGDPHGLRREQEPERPTEQTQQLPETSPREPTPDEGSALERWHAHLAAIAEGRDE
jgi:hypothetical protein